MEHGAQVLGGREKGTMVNENWVLEWSKEAIGI
jgi:hypothetical protein